MSVNVKKSLLGLRFFASRFLDIFSVLFLILNFIIWHLNNKELDISKYRLYHQGIQLLFAVVLINFDKFNPKKFIKDNLIFILITILGLYNSLNIVIDFNGQSVDMGMRSFELMLEAFPSFILIIVAYRMANRRAFVTGLSIVLVLILGYALLAIGQDQFNLNTFFGQVITSSGNRHQSILNNSNVLGEYAFIGIFISFFLSFLISPLWLKLVILLPVPILGHVMVLSGSRTGLFMTASYYAVINLYYKYFKKTSKMILMIGNLILFFSVILLIMGYLDFYVDSIRSEISLSGRDTIWFNGFKIIEQFQFSGIGYNNFTYVYNEWFGVLTSPHNMFIGMTAEFGILALGLTTVWFGVLFIRNHNQIITNVNSKFTTYLIFFNAFYLTFFIGQMTEYSLLKFSSINTLFLALQGLNFQMIELSKEKKYEPLKLSVLYLVMFGCFYVIVLRGLNSGAKRYLYSLVFFVLLTGCISISNGLIKHITVYKKKKSIN
ncbi:integral membrane protein, predicted O-antigen ligase-related protein (the O-antigen, a lipopolysaccharide is present in the outer membrane in gram-negative bacteria) [Paracholeplasma brassicae]|uniref:Integral membrane protein, predicted O-antigen ligase-related protein (The O-antigen, a lipopolysaccharide is present in the outer membrane in gram-negative bacteria) n=1 Tax=Acholeplasma brassicae TaxID=61635 RepID=U4KM78_9MOLU|nr:O-antigen ligase family protein [Paracholeplasma brassicae]CCV65145.1 integral membrane protein, predicted O-antigen ligase-related protein (the O-antigen, a lipopolysaccharide is present in the outer membrane in gram-negative bacteria) [Paracholeplasma brassicae]